MHCFSAESRKQVGKKLLYGVIIILFFVLLYFTNSRTTLISLIFVLCFYLVFQINSIHAKAILIAIGGIIGVLLTSLLIMELTNGDFFSKLGIDFSIKSLLGRLSLWSGVLQKFDHNILGGYGYFSSRFYLLSDVAWGYNSHNTYLEVLSSTGLIGFILMFFFYFSTWSIIKYYKIFSLALLYLIYALIESFMEVTLFSPSVVMNTTLVLVFYMQFTLQLPPTENHAAKKGTEHVR